MSIPKNAKICPYCRNPIGISLAGKLAIGFILIAVLSGIFGEHNPAPPSKISTSASIDTKPMIVLTGKAKEIKSQHPSWSDENCITLAAGSINIGMTAEQVRVGWHEPYKINRSVFGNNQIHEQWVMYESGSTYLYFENGILTSLQQPGK